MSGDGAVEDVHKGSGGLSYEIDESIFNCHRQRKHGDGANSPSAAIDADTLGPHLGYGRGCVMCHAPHSGAGGNGITTADTASGNVALWGQNLSPLYGQLLNFGGGTITSAPGVTPVTYSGGYPVTLPATNATVSISDGASIVILCLSCHDGNLAKVGMMKGQTVETLPVVGGNAPTLLGNDGTSAGNYENDHPVGPNAIFGCGGASKHQWDCTLAANSNTPSMTGTASSVFMQNYGFAVKLYTTGGVYDTVTCTSCHNQHSETIYSGTMGGAAGFYQTAFFLNGYYNPTSGGNSTAQFCRQCHGGNSNEMLGQLTVKTN